MTDQSADEAAIVALMLRARRAAAERDFDTLSDCHVQAPYAARWNASRVGGSFVRQGWDAIAAHIRQSIADPADQPPAPDDGQVENLNIRISGDLAWVSYTRRYDGARPHRTGPDPAHHVRIVERHDGQWKFAVIAFLDPGIGRPGSGHIRLDADGAVLWMDETATAAFEAEDDLLVRNGRLRVRDSRTNQKLQAAIHWAASLDYGVLPGRGALPVVLDVGEGVPARLWWVIADSGAIYFSFGQSGHTQQLDAAAAAFGLSAAQRIVAAHVVGGLSLSQIAEAMGVKPSTVRTHLDRIFEKTGVRNQTALVRVLLSASAPPL